MSKTKHTPGPWTVIDLRRAEKPEQKLTIGSLDEYCAGRPPVVCRIQNVVNQTPIDENDVANARLIAAAPDLLEACLAAHASAFPSKQQHPTMFAAWKKLEAAITKATQSL